MSRPCVYMIMLFLACFTCLNRVNAQNTETGDLEKQLSLAKNDSVRIELLLRLSKLYDNVDTTKARSYYRLADSLADKSGSDILKGFSAEIAGVLATRYDQQKALQHYNRAIRLLTAYKEIPRVNRTLASLDNNVGVIHYFNGDIEGALRYFMNAVKYYEENEPENLNCGYGYGNISTTYADLNRIDHAVVYSRKFVDFADQAKNKNLVMSASIAHGSNLLKLSRFDEGMLYLQNAKGIAEELKNNYNLHLYFYNIGTYYFDQRSYKNSLEQLEHALRYARIMDSPNEIASMLNTMAKCHIRLGQYPAAHEKVQEAMNLATKNKLRNIEQESNEVLSELNEKSGHYEAALRFKKRAIELRDSIYKEENIRRIEFLDAQYQSEKKEKEILELQQEGQAQAFSIRQKSTLNYILAGSVAALILTGFLAYRNIRHRQQLSRQQAEIDQRRIRELEKDKQLVAVDALLKGQEEERSRLARDLHDGLGGLLSGVKFSLSNMKDNLIVTPDNMAVFERTLDMLDTSIRELRRVAHNMMPEMLTRFGLDEALKEYVNAINSTKLLNVQYQSMGMENRLDTTIEIAVYRIIQELVNNILKHAEATEVLIQLVRDGDRLNIVVEDNGKGFDTATLKDHIGAGWVNIRSRVEYLKGQLDLHANRGRGVLVNIELNLGYDPGIHS